MGETCFIEGRRSLRIGNDNRWSGGFLYNAGEKRCGNSVLLSRTSVTLLQYHAVLFTPSPTYSGSEMRLTSSVIMDQRVQRGGQHCEHVCCHGEQR